MSETGLTPAAPGPAGRIRAWWGPRIVTQIVTVCAVLALFWLLGQNTATTMERIGIAPGFGFLGHSANFEIGETSIPFSAGNTYAYAMLVGLINTVKVALLGCILTTILGVTIGIAGLSGNLLLAGLVRGYIEIVRNTPLLLQLFFWVSLTKAFPPPRQAAPLFDAVFLTNRGVFFPAPIFDGMPDGAGWLIGLPLAGYGLFLWFARRRGALTLRRGLLAALACLALAAALLAGNGVSIGFDVPVLAGFNIRGGVTITPEFTALLVGLTVKFSAAIAEIVRAGIQSVGQGQWEAARSLGMHRGQIMRLIVIPQALRVITPLITSSYLDLTKDSSLAVAIGYPDLVSVINTTANTTGQAFEALIILIGVFVTINLSVSYAMNVYNRRVALRGSGPR
ncbi:general L-amino acid transport system permease protein [Pseudochelatococcus lubricantis]|uniref:General L-amino acid transport system permease protein n=1 Tax=Pseudochelatococcus lubricantis TaxID=1538102 RepID=A0ABX0V1B0_9HYPH|nr:general L-amino acid transport system permease protein [Pseudochelatococcus lubricantis]